MTTSCRVASWRAIRLLEPIADLGAIHPQGVEQLGGRIWPLTRQQGEQDVLQPQRFADRLPAEPGEDGPAGWRQSKPLVHPARDGRNVDRDVDPY